MVEFRTRFDRIRVPFETEGKTMTKQSFKKDCDVNNILKKYERTGLIDHVNKFEGKYGDFTSTQDYQSCIDQAIKAEEMFMSLPSSVRKRFDNDPGQFLAFVDNPENLGEMIELGLAKARPAPKSEGETKVEPKVEEA